MRNNKGQFVKGQKSDLTQEQRIKRINSLKEKWKSRADYHGMYNTKFHNSWRSMKNRCDGTSSEECNKKYHHKGIRYDIKWKEFMNFYADMYPGYVEGRQLDRIDNNLGYSKANCRWATSKENANNKPNNVRIEYMGKMQTLSQWADELNISIGALRNRYFKFFAKGRYGKDRLFR